MIKIISPVMDENNKFTHPKEEIQNFTGYSIFLAGPSPRKDYNNNWRYDAFKILENISKENKIDILVFNPINTKFIPGNIEYLHKQISWEIEAMSASDRIVFWIPRSEKDPAFTTNIEFGEWFKDQKSFVGMPPEGIKNDYLKIRLEYIKKPYYEKLDELLVHTICSFKEE